MRRFMALVCGATLAAGSTVAIAQEGAKDGPRPERGPVPVVRPLPHWIGAMCAPTDDVLRAHLKIESGLVVLNVMPGSPAADAGLAQYDVLTAIDGKPLVHLTDLVERVNAAGDAEIKLDVIRAGEKQIVKVQPAKRPEADVLRRFVGPEGEERNAVPDPEKLRELAEKWRENLPEAEARRMQDWLERMQRGEAMPLRMHVFGPGVVMPQGGAGLLPKDVRVTMKKSGDKPAEIHVERGDEKWDVTENELDKLPEDLRGPIAAMLGTGAPRGAMLVTPHGAASGIAFGSGGAGDVQIKIDPVDARPQPAAELEVLKKQVEQLQRQVQELQKLVPPATDKSPEGNKKAKPKS